MFLRYAPRGNLRPSVHAAGVCRQAVAVAAGAALPAKAVVSAFRLLTTVVTASTLAVLVILAALSRLDRFVTTLPVMLAAVGTAP